MANEIVTARNTRNGQLVRVRKSIAENPILGAELVIVTDGAKPYAEGLYEPKTPEEYAETTRGKREVKPKKEEV